MGRRTRDHDAERTAIRAATKRLLAGTPLRSTSGKLTTTELITEAGLRRDVVYDHTDLVEEFKAGLKAQDSTPAAFHHLAEQNAALAGTGGDQTETGRGAGDHDHPAEGHRRAVAGIATGPRGIGRSRRSHQVAHRKREANGALIRD